MAILERGPFVRLERRGVLEKTAKGSSTSLRKTKGVFVEKRKIRRPSGEGHQGGVGVRPEKVMRGALSLKVHKRGRG